MRRTTENQGNARPFPGYFSPRNNVKDQHQPHFTTFLQETPMKSYRLPNHFGYPPPRRVLPIQSPELCHRDRHGPPRHLLHPPRPNYPSGFVPSSPANFGSSGNRFHPMPRGSLGPLQHHHYGTPVSYGSFAAISPTNCGTTVYRPGVFHPVPPPFMKDLSNHSPPVHIRRVQGTESKDTLSYSGSKNATAQRQASNKDQSNDGKSHTHTTQLQKPLSPSSITRAVQDVFPPALSDSEHRSLGNSQRPAQDYQPPPTQSSDGSSGSSLSVMHSPVAPSQDQQPKRTPASENLIPVDLNSSSQKRRREFEGFGDSAKKQCFPGMNSGKAHTPKSTVGKSLSPSLLPQPSAGPSSVLELPAKTTDSHLCTEPTNGQSSHFVTLSSTLKPTQSSCSSPSPKPCLKRQPSMGAKQAYITSPQNHTGKLVEVRSPSKPSEECLKKRSEDNVKTEKSSSVLSSEVPQKVTDGTSPVQSGSHHSGHTHCSSSVLPVKTLGRGDHVEERRKSDSSTPKPASKTNTGSLSCRPVERNKTNRSRKPVAIPNDINDLFTPDPKTYIISNGHKTVKPKMEGLKSPTSEKSCSPSTLTSSSTPVTGSSCHKNGSPHTVDTKVSISSSTHHPPISMPTITLERVKLEKLKSIPFKTNYLKNSPITSSDRQLQDDGAKSDEKRSSLLHNSLRRCTSETGSTTSSSHCSQSPLLERQSSEGRRKPVSEEDPIDVELDLGLSFALDMDLTQSSQSSEDEQLLSLHEMMERVTKPPDTPEKGAFSEPSTPGHHSCLPRTQLPSTAKSGIYKNNLDQMLKEINNNKKAKEIETQLLNRCEEDLQRIAECEEAEENQEEGVNTEQQEFLQRYSLMSNAIREVPPGETVFNLEKFGCIFDHNSLELRKCMVDPQETAQKTLLWSSPAQLRLHVNIGLFQEAYDSRSPCPAQVTRFLFKMMSVHNERMVSEKILQALCDIACTAAYQIVKKGSQQFKVWVPSLADVALVLMNMGAAFVTLFPFENLQPPFTEGDLLEDIYIKNESPSDKEQSSFPEHNCNNILKYLSYCMGLCPRAYTDDELLLLLTVVGRVGLDTRLILQSSVELYPLQYKIVNNIRDWDTMLPKICLALTDLTDDHHNMCLLVQLLPDNTHGKQLRRHLSLSMISKLLDGNCTYRPTEQEFQLSELRPYLRRMQPSAILRSMLSSSSRNQTDKGEDTASPDQQSYYLCYSLLTLANEASNFQFFPAHQKKQLLFLCSELETHVKCDIREDEKRLYRSKVKDLVARISTKWTMLLQRTRPLHGKLYDYWQPMAIDTLTSSQEEQGMDDSDDGEEPVTEDEDETSENEEVIMTAEDEEEEGNDTMDGTDKTENDMKPEEMEGNEEVTETVHGEMNQAMPQVHEQMEAENIERTEAHTENLVETEETSNNNQVAVCDLVS
ncbi:SMC5-SMC6 complex localization factor protein 2 isoform X2 [Centropristis striata]|uniref:SMC5-SMC6 complex localization factor protein 2 isoform X2 n=1 Tax=Centropristis striata TaxID=184440 RepID=UPI0027E0DBFF|nr:SMC5-SMC6 complex localization factor protein 2 isoform X2 [Centropristis striata]